MEISDLLILLGGLALFLYGMKMMSTGLSTAAGDKLQMILEKLTSNRFLGVLVGAGITALIQSSSATTIMTIGFVNSGLMSLQQAVWIIMGANIGTTITGQLIALNIGEYAPVFALIGVILVTFFKNKKVNCIGEIIAGLGILFIGMNTMSSAMLPLSESSAFVQFITSTNNPILAVSAGAVFTAMIQSSSAAIGVLQALASGSLIGFNEAAFVLFGTNIGSCITAFIASLNGNRNAKRATIVHLLFNFIGTGFFLVICLTTPLLNMVAGLTPNAPMSQIANLHTIFNVLTTLLLLPFGVQLAALATKILPIKAKEKEDTMEASFIKDGNVGTYAIAMGKLKRQLVYMFEITQANVNLVMHALTQNERLDEVKIQRNEEKINYINIELTKYMAKVSSIELKTRESIRSNSLLKISSDIERIGDHAINLSEYVLLVQKKEVHFNADVLKELTILHRILKECFAKLSEESFFDYEDKFEYISRDEQKIDELTFCYRQQQIERLKHNESDAKSTVTYSEMLTDIERISDHIMNIAEECQGSKISLKIDEF